MGSAAEIYNRIFSLDCIDDNNYYIELNGKQIDTIQLTEPTIKVGKLLVSKGERSDNYAIPDRQSYRIPLVKINDVIIEQTQITNFTLDYSSFIPTVCVEFVDIKNQMLSVNSMKDGSIIRIYIGGLGDESYYKPIRQDFLVTDIKKITGGNQNLGDVIQYKVSGKLNVPIGYKKESWSNSECTSQQELFNLAVYTGLGYATNFDRGTNDSMQWRSMPNTNYFDFMKDITSHACYSPNTFFTSFIDQYYVLNFVECHSLLSHGGSKSDKPAIIYRNVQHNLDVVDKDGNKKELNIDTGTQPKNEKEKDEKKFRNAAQYLTDYFISNNEYYNGWTNYIEEYVELSNGSSSTTDGYRRNIGYCDSNVGNWGISNVKFSIPPIDNLKRESDTQKIMSLDELKKELYIPINLVQTNNSDYVSNEDEINNINDTQSFTFLGNVDTSNTYKLYYFAKEQNDFQMNCLKKCGLKIKLQNYNPSIAKFSRIWVDIYDKHKTSNVEISKFKDVENKTLYDKYKQYHNDNIINFEDEGEGLTKFNNKETNKSLGNSKYNRGLSGWYVVTELKYTFDRNNVRLNTILVLNRIEKKPLFKTEYNIAQKGIEKYKEDNIIEKIITDSDDYSYAMEE